MVLSNIDGNKSALDEIILTRIMRLDAIIHGVVFGLVIGLGVFVATNWLVIKGGVTVGPHLDLLGQFFIGYEVTFLGSFIGFAYGFVCGFSIGYFVARVYNFLVGRRGTHE